MKIISVNLGEKRTIQWKNKTVETGIFKSPVNKPIFLGIEDVENDAVVDRKYHGGIDQAVYGYSKKHYAYFKQLYPDLDWHFGMFGENLTIDNLDETKIHVGDIFTSGEVILEATKPRQPCMKLGVRFNDMKVVKQFWNSTMSGVYFKILQTGNISSGDELVQIKSCTGNPTISDIYTLKRKEKSQ